MRLNQVPKMLLVLRKDWAPAAFCISFKVSPFIHATTQKQLWQLESDFCESNLEFSLRLIEVEHA